MRLNAFVTMVQMSKHYVIFHNAHDVRSSGWEVLRMRTIIHLLSCASPLPPTWESTGIVILIAVVLVLVLVIVGNSNSTSTRICTRTSISNGNSNTNTSTSTTTILISEIVIVFAIVIVIAVALIVLGPILRSSFCFVCGCVSALVGFRTDRSAPMSSLHHGPRASI